MFCEFMLIGENKIVSVMGAKGLKLAFFSGNRCCCGLLCIAVGRSCAVRNRRDD